MKEKIKEYLKVKMMIRKLILKIHNHQKDRKLIYKIIRLI